LLKQLFDLFYDEEVVSEKVFYTWKADEIRPRAIHEQGHEMNALAAESFFEWLEEPGQNRAPNQKRERKQPIQASIPDPNLLLLNR
jgi:gluconate kinase